MKSKKNFIICIFLLINFLAFSEKISVNTFFSNEDIAKVKKGDIITRMYIKYNSCDENTHLNINVPSTKYANEDFTIYEMITDEKAFFPYDMNTEASKLQFYNILAAYSKLSGMTYFSRRIQQEQELIVDCYRIESPKKKSKMDDPVYSDIKPSITNYFMQKDNKFGNLLFESNIYNEDNNFVLINTCQQPISKLMINLSKKGEYKIITYFIYDKEVKGFYYYSVFLSRIRADILLKNDNKKFLLHPTTFSNRLRGATVHFAKLLGKNKAGYINPWDEDMLVDGYYKTY